MATRSYKRGNGEGSLTQRPDGRWMARFYITLPSGERRRQHITLKDRDEVMRRMRDEMAKSDKGLALSHERRSVEDWLNYWITEIHPRNVKDSTLELHRGYVERNIIPEIGKVSLIGLKPDHVRRMLVAWDRKGMGTRSQQIARNVLSAALRDAMKLEYVHRNVVRLVDPPKHVTRQRHVWTAGQARMFLAAVEEHRYYGLFLIFFCFGLRRGEATGLTWGDVDFDNDLIRIRQQVYYVGHIQHVGELKTPESRRILAMPRVIRNELLAERERRGDPAAHEFLYLSGRGNPVDGRTLIQLFHKISDWLELPRITLHEIRHTVTTLLHQRGISPKTAQNILGHKSVTTTLQVYTHSTEQQRSMAISEIAGVYR